MIHTWGRIGLVTLSFGGLFWVIDSVLDSLWFNRGSFLESFATAVTPHELYVRFVVIALFVLFGLLWVTVRAQQQKTEHALQESEDRYRT